MVKRTTSPGQSFSNSWMVTKLPRLFDLKEAVVHPVIRHYAGMKRAARLRDLVLVMRKHQIDAAAVDVEGLAEMLPGHGRALNVPARPARRLDAGRRRPAWLVRVRRLSQDRGPQA